MEAPLPLPVVFFFFLFFFADRGKAVLLLLFFFVYNGYCSCAVLSGHCMFFISSSFDVARNIRICHGVSGRYKNLPRGSLSGVTQGLPSDARL